MADSKDVKAAHRDNDEVAAKVADENEAGHRGFTPDITPNENYTVAGVTAGKPTPETDPELAAKIRQASRPF